MHARIRREANSFRPTHSGPLIYDNTIDVCVILTMSALVMYMVMATLVVMGNNNGDGDFDGGVDGGVGDVDDGEDGNYVGDGGEGDVHTRDADAVATSMTTRTMLMVLMQCRDWLTQDMCLLFISMATL